MSKEEKPIHYEPHPVSPERKAELLAKGVRIIDAVYDPNPKPAKAEKAADQGKQPQQQAKQSGKAEKAADQAPAVGEQPGKEGEAPKE